MECSDGLWVMETRSRSCCFVNLCAHWKYETLELFLNVEDDPSRIISVFKSSSELKEESGFRTIKCNVGVSSRQRRTVALFSWRMDEGIRGVLRERHALYDLPSSWWWERKCKSNIRSFLFPSVVLAPELRGRLPVYVGYAVVRVNYWNDL